MHVDNSVCMVKLCPNPLPPYCPMATLRPRAVCIGGEAHHYEGEPGEEATETLEAICTRN